MLPFQNEGKSLLSAEPLVWDTICHKLRTGNVQVLGQSKTLSSRVATSTFLASLRVSCKHWPQCSQTRHFWRCLWQEHFRFSFPGDSPVSLGRCHLIAMLQTHPSVSCWSSPTCHHYCSGLCPCSHPGFFLPRPSDPYRSDNCPAQATCFFFPKVLDILKTSGRKGQDGPNTSISTICPNAFACMWFVRLFAVLCP